VRFLRDSGLRPRALDDVAAARALAGSERPAVVLVDTALPDAVPWMEDLVLDGVPFVATTVREDEAAQARALGARAALLRPLEPRIVLAALDRATDAVPAGA
jgi:DNA-binding response OmpR family regulator